MKKLAELFGSSSRELREVRTITVCAMLAAAAIILVNFRIELTSTQRIGFSGIPNQLVSLSVWACGGGSCLEGPWTCAQVSHQAHGRLFCPA